VVKGAVMVLRPLSCGRRQILDIVGPGSMVGFTAHRTPDCTAWPKFRQRVTELVVACGRHSTIANANFRSQPNPAVSARLADGRTRVEP